MKNYMWAGEVLRWRGKRPKGVPSDEWKMALYMCRYSNMETIERDDDYIEERAIAMTLDFPAFDFKAYAGEPLPGSR